MPRLKHHHQPVLACRLGSSAILLAGPVDFVLEEKAALFDGDRLLARPYSGCVVHSPAGSHYLLLLCDETLAAGERLPSLTLRQPGHADLSLLPVSIDSQPQAFGRWSAALPEASRQAIFSFLAGEVAQLPDMTSAAEFIAACRQSHALAGSRGITLTHAWWLTPSVLYGECTVGSEWLAENESELVLMSQNGMHPMSVKVFQIGEPVQAFIALADAPVYGDHYESFRLTFFSNGAVYALEQEAGYRAYGLEFMEVLKGRPLHQLVRIREELCAAILKHCQSNKKDMAAAGLLQKLQYYVPLPPVPLTDPALPFNLYTEEVISIADEGVFVGGWLRDPLQRLTRLTAVSDLGLRLELKGNLHRFPRPDVAESYRTSPYGGYEEDHGFVAYVPLNREQKRLLNGVANLHGFRFEADLKDGAVLEMIPEIRHRDAFSAREFVLKSLPQNAISEKLLEDCLAPAAQSLQRLCMEQIRVREVLHFGSRLSGKPLASIVIPLYKRLEYLKPQLACFATDEEIKNCELIYVLDSPEQAHEAIALLSELCALYPLAVSLVIMQRNSGYAAANNHGAAQATSDMLLLLNSDILPRNPGWLGAMLAFYRKEKNIGALAPKLLYEDGSLQHAGMVFEKTGFPFWLNLHNWKGYPEEYPQACATRIVPAVTGACLMVSKERFDAVGGFTTDYVIGDFEDSDLCLKLAEAGYESWYFAEATLYHLERQSMPLNAGYQGSQAWQVNARRHHARWDGLIAKRMQEYTERHRRAAEVLAAQSSSVRKAS